MQIDRYVVGMFYTNTYLLTINDECILIDPASKPEKLIEVLGNKKLLAILLTHGHFDHIKAVDGLVKEYNCPVYINENDEYLIRNKNQGGEFGLQNCPSISVPVKFLKEESLTIGPFTFDIIFTPGHTKGSVCYKFADDLFTGDTLFKGSIGRTDLEGGSERDLRASLRILKELPDNIKIYPGHDEISTLEQEKAYNPFLVY